MFVVYLYVILNFYNMFFFWVVSNLCLIYRFLKNFFWFLVETDEEIITNIYLPYWQIDFNFIDIYFWDYYLLYLVVVWLVSLEKKNVL